MEKIETLQSSKQIQKQSLILSNKMLASLQIMKMPVLELHDAILQETEKNIALEIVKSGNLEKSSIKKRGKTNKNSFYESEVIDNMTRDDESLYSFLLSQLAFVKTETSVKNLASLIIQNLDEKGFNIAPIKELISSNKNIKDKCTEKDRQDALNIVRHLYPQGCAFDNVAASLQFQLKLLYKKQIAPISPTQRKIYAHLSFIIEKDINLLAKDEHYIKQLIKQKYGHKISIGEIQEMLKLVKQLNPYPGYLFEGGRESTQYIIPDVFVEHKENKIEIRTNISVLPKIKISSDIKKLAQEDSEAGVFARSKIEEGEIFISSIEERSATLFKVVEMIVVFQRDFFYYGLSFLTPLRQKDVANELKLSNSTISRIANSKYLECKWGIFPLSYFFTQKIAEKKQAVYSASSYVASGYSRQACKEMIKHIIEEKHVSDRQIVEILSKKGINIARRTIAKYRKELGISKKI